jgi:hypothetical protein
LKQLLLDLQVQFEEADGDVPDHKVTMLMLGFCSVPLLVEVDDKNNYRVLVAVDVPIREELAKILRR